MFLHYLDLAWRSIKKTPILSLLMVLAISVGIGITITTLNVYKMMAFNPAGEKSDQLLRVQLWSQGPDSWDNFPQLLTYQDVQNLRNIEPLVRQTAMHRTGGVIQTDDPSFAASMQSVRSVDRDFFKMFDVSFLHGSPWAADADVNAAYHAVISSSLNEKLFGSGNNVGKTFYFDKRPYQVVGITEDWNPQPKYYDPSNGAFNDAEQIFIPFSLLPIEKQATWGNTSGWRYEKTNNFQDRLNSERVWTMFWAEFENAEQIEDYKRQLAAYVEQQKAIGRFTDNRSPEDSVQLVNVEQWLENENVVDEDNKILVGLGFLFLSVCLVNILGLLLTKFLKRAPEVGVRRAIGASRRQIFSQYMVEVGVIGLIGGAIGLALAWGALAVLGDKFGTDAALTQLDNSMWFLTPTIAIGTALLAGLYPAWIVCRTKPSVYLKSQ
ncbi:FtsX-like permease family protein [Parashewanella spongiae]|uniref:FtsX-like permease family protein n=1 Tax=Parashewanella spongiae TaxID=342950 RepID=A0A3A6U3F6_9GAMM|nr:ABC transporter permease [Parashewanella spongiae]MCL1078124.1 ABC transporter permease [Parashewanella spongiae]RJY16371.1 FtsX-like permease family protein [Parashewanella spongiae]